MSEHKLERAVKLFAISNQMLEHELDKIEQEYSIDLGRGHVGIAQKDETYYPQIDREIRAEAADMAQHYEVFYSLEKSIRTLVRESLVAVAGSSWWTSGRIPNRIQQDADSRLQRERDSGYTLRSTDPLDFTTFGELGEVIKSNWDIFGSLFSSPKAVEKIMSSLNMLRGPVAHCSPLAEDEVIRLKLTVRDWFRLME